MAKLLVIFVMVLTSLKQVPVDGSKILVFPMAMVKNTALRNVEKLAAILAENGNEIHLLANEGYEVPGFLTKLGVLHIKYPRTPDMGPFKLTMKLNQLAENIEQTLSRLMHTSIRNCENLLGAKPVLQRLKAEKYDMILHETADHCKLYVSNYLQGIPVVEFMTYDTFQRIDFKEYPLPMSYLPCVFSGFKPQMSFIQRVQNVYCFIMMKGVRSYWKYGMDKVAAKYGLEEKSLESLALVYGGFPMEYPAPTMPDMIYLNGILTNHPEPLEPALEKFVQSSGDNGVIVFSFGSMISEYGEHYANLFAEALAQLPQKVLWKLEGPVPRTLGKNTKLLTWLPQTDLLAHPKTKLFISHCGINSAYETVYYGVPVVAIPIDLDQFQNTVRLTDSHAMGIQLDLHSLTVDKLVRALKEVIKNPKYKENAMKLRSYLRDQPISGKDLFLYWVDYVIRHKGVSHLKPYGRHLPWYQFYMLDVISFLLLVVSAIVLAILIVCRAMCKRWRSIPSTKSKRE